MKKKRTFVRELWLKQGLELLSREGPAALSIDLLCRKTQKSKGSFYFQFKNRDQYISALLEYYESQYPLESLPESQDTEQRMKYRAHLREEAFKIPSRLEIAIRAWSLYDPIAKNFQDGLDKKRLAFSEKNYLRAGYDPKEARLKAYKNYCTYIGLQQLRSLHSQEEFTALAQKIFLPSE